MSDFAERLLPWFDVRRRELPWRAARGELADPYAVWVSEVMLQQTRVEVVVGYFERWMERFPTIFDLARASEDEVLSLWQGLGYYSRARRLRQGAIHLVEGGGGQLPVGASALLGVPGIGPYSAGAIASIAQGERTPVVDGNVVRVLTRHFGLRGDPAKKPLKERLWQLAAQLVPGERPGDFNQALMELGATVCTPARAACYDCPLQSSCAAFAQGLVSELPELPKRPASSPLVAAALLVRAGERLLLVRQPSNARWWAGLWTLPFGVEEPRPGDREQALAIARRVRDGHGLAGALEPLGAPLVHPITRFRISLSAFVLRVPRLEESLHPAASARGRAQRAGTELVEPRPAGRSRAHLSGSSQPGRSGEPLVRLLTGVEVDQAGLPAPHRRLVERSRAFRSPASVH